MSAAPEIPETLEPAEEAVELSIIPLSTVLCAEEDGALSPGAARLWMREHAPGFLRILEAIATGEGLSDDLHVAAHFLANDLDELVAACFYAADERTSVPIRPSEDWEGVDRPMRLRHLAALATSASDLFEDQAPAVRLPYQYLGAELRRRVAEEREGAR